MKYARWTFALVLLIGVGTLGCTDTSVSTSGTGDDDRTEQSDGDWESDQDYALDGDLDQSEEDDQIDGDDESTEAEGDVENSEVEDTEPDTDCTPNASWCEDNILHTCDDQGQEHVPLDCGKDTCLESEGEDAYCRPEWALEFDGTGSVTLSEKTLIRQLDSATIEAWVNLSVPDPLAASPMDGHILYIDGLQGHEVTILKVFYEGGVAFDEWNSTTGWVRAWTEAGVVPMDRWTHIAAVKYPGWREIYVDGARVLKEAISQPEPPEQQSVPASAGLWTYGAIDELRLSGVARYAEDFTPPVRHEPDADTVALWHMDEGSGQTIADEVESREGTLEGGVEWTAGVSQRNLENR
ncbi:MAG: hypothetical protein C4523_05350 [Myxococcales bacterium]|nr:MAG: hypothetical protein C4523_05350 [Myxococcales bacterium]